MLFYHYTYHYHSFYIPNFLFYIYSLGQLNNMICILVFVRSLY